MKTQEWLSLVLVGAIPVGLANIALGTSWPVVIASALVLGAAIITLDVVVTKLRKKDS